MADILLSWVISTERSLVYLWYESAPCLPEVEVAGVGRMDVRIGCCDERRTNESRKQEESRIDCLGGSQIDLVFTIVKR